MSTVLATVTSLLSQGGIMHYSQQLQGVVTDMSRVEAFATGIKIESSDQSPF